jgi:hypothetical protein
LQLVVRFNRPALAKRELRGKKMVDCLDGSWLPAEQGIDGAFRPRVIAGQQGNRRFIDEVRPVQLRDLFKAIPKFKGLRLAGSGEEPRDGSDRFRLVRPKLVGRGRFLSGVVPLLFVDQAKRTLRVAPGLECLDPVHDRARAENPTHDERTRQEEANDGPFPFSPLKPNLFGCQHYVVQSRHGAASYFPA